MFLRLIGQSLKFRTNSESGNIFLAIFGAIALVGLLGASIMTFMKGPLSTSVKLTKMNTAENQMSIGAQVAVMATASQADNGDCDADGTVEPVPFRSPTTEIVPVGGGLVPLSVGINKKDPWGTEYGYCVWNQGSTTTGAGCGANMLAGTGGAGYTVYPVVALVSAGPDKIFTTTCRSFADADVTGNGNLLDPTDLPMVSKAVETDDDIITSFTYEEATSVSGGLWNLKAGAPGVAVINKSIETSGVANLKGGVLLPDKSFIDCTLSENAGVMAKNGTTGIEICDGTGTWTAITGGGATGNNLVLNPNVSSGMNVVGTCGTSTCYSSNMTFTLTNKAATTSVLLTTSLSNTLNFEFVSNGCNNQTLAANAECQMVVRAKASGNLSYAGTLNITGGNSPFATLDGTASSFPGCNVGGQTTGGYYVGCGVSGAYNLIVTPSGCTSGNTNPTCAGGADTLVLFNNAVGVTGQNLRAIIGTTLYTGQQNTANLMAYSGGVYSFPAASWCSGLVYAGFDDWFLPNLSELTMIYNNRAAVGSTASYYWSSTESNFDNYTEWRHILFSSGAISYGSGASNAHVRCMRRDPANTVSPMADTTPIAYTLPPSYGGPSEIRTSNVVTIYAVTQPIAVSISGGTSSRYSINGGAYTSAAGTATNGDTITLQTTSAGLGQESVVTFTTGSITNNWLVRTPGNNTIRVFTTQGAVNGSQVSDATCTSRASAAGLPGVWLVMAGSGASSFENKIPWNWKFLKNMNGQTVATSAADFLDGTLSAVMSVNENGGLPYSNLVYTGLISGFVSDAGAQCGSWDNTATNYQRLGAADATSGGSYFSTTVPYTSCGTSRSIVCMESNAAGVDLDPNEVGIRPQAIFTSGGTGTSNTVTITGVTDAVNVSIVPASGTASIIKAGLDLAATTTTAGLNETLAFTLTAPTTLGTKNTATITIGPDTYSWFVGYADIAREAKVFVTSSNYNTEGGLAAADNICKNLAASSPYGLSTNWKAMLSDSNVNMADRVPWNWGILKTVTGGTIVDGGYNDMLDGSLDNAINVSEQGNAYSPFVWTGTNKYGIKYNPNGMTPTYFKIDWTNNNGNCGTQAMVGSAASATLAFESGVGSCSSAGLYCIEDVDSTVTDTVPATPVIAYAIQVPTSSRQTSAATMISGMSTGATTTLSVTATAGNPTFKVNGGSEVTSASIKNGDSVVFLLDAPASGNSNNRMTLAAGGSTLGYWRVWTGDPTGTLIKRVFVTSQGYEGTFGGVTGGDSLCQTRAAAQSLGGTWKAILSGIQENEAAVNRIGYNWWKLRLVDGTDVVVAPNLWTASPALLSPIVKNEAGVVTTGVNVFSNTTSLGLPASSTSSGDNCFVWTSGTGDGRVGNSSSSNYQWIMNGASYAVCNNSYRGRLYCIEQ